MTHNLSVDLSDETDPAIVALDGALGRAGNKVSDLREALGHAGDDLTARFKDGQPVTDLVRLRASLVDRVLIWLWREHAGPLRDSAAIVAVGGYGRGELHPCSDVDIMLLVGNELPADGEQLLSSFLTSLWDIGLDIGHSVRTVKQCQQEAKADITVATTLIEARLLHGPEPII